MVTTQLKTTVSTGSKRRVFVDALTDLGDLPPIVSVDYEGFSYLRQQGVEEVAECSILDVERISDETYSFFWDGSNIAGIYRLTFRVHFTDDTQLIHRVSLTVNHDPDSEDDGDPGSPGEIDGGTPSSTFDSTPSQFDGGEPDTF